MLIEMPRKSMKGHAPMLSPPNRLCRACGHHEGEEYAHGTYQQGCGSLPAQLFIVNFHPYQK